MFFSQLMARESLEKLGFKDLMDSPPSQADGDAKPWAGLVFIVDSQQRYIKGKDCNVKGIIMATVSRWENTMLSVTALI